MCVVLVLVERSVGECAATLEGATILVYTSLELSVNTDYLYIHSKWKIKTNVNEDNEDEWEDTVFVLWVGGRVILFSYISISYSTPRYKTLVCRI